MCTHTHAHLFWFFCFLNQIITSKLRGMPSQLTTIMQTLSCRQRCSVGSAWFRNKFFLSFRYRYEVTVAWYTFPLWNSKMAMRNKCEANDLFNFSSASTHGCLPGPGRHKETHSPRSQDPARSLDNTPHRPSHGENTQQNEVTCHKHPAF